MSKGFGSKLKGFFVEEENSYDQLVGSVDYDFQNETVEEVETFVNTGASVNNVSSIKDIYNIGNMGDLSKSVYKVEEIKSVLPNALPTNAKKESVLGMMKVSNLTVSDVQIDTENRKNILNSVLENFTKDTQELTLENENEIKELEKRINDLKESINVRNVEQEQQEKIIKDELNKIDSIVEFIL